MHLSAPSLLAALFGFLAVCGLGYQALVILGIARYRRLTKAAAEQAARSAVSQSNSELPPISILKPLRGAEPRLAEALRSHCLQDYPRFELLFGVQDENDAAVAAFERLRLEFPAQPMRLIVCPEVLGTNRKVSTLVQLLPAARYDVILINDADIVVPPDYLRAIAAGFNPQGKQPVCIDRSNLPAAPSIGLVTTLYRASAGPSLASRIEALTISTDFAGAVLSALAFEGGLTFGLGATLAVRRQALEAIGGLEPLLNYLADDYELGNRTSRAGFQLALAPVVVETALPASSFREMFQHQLRWARTIRDRRLRGYIGLAVTHVVPWAFLAMLAAGFAPWSLVLFGTTAVLRFGVAAALCHGVLQDLQSDLDLWLLPLRDVVGLLVWLACFAGNTVWWRGECFRLRQGVLEKIGE